MEPPKLNPMNLKFSSVTLDFVTPNGLGQRYIISRQWKTVECRDIIHGESFYKFTCPLGPFIEAAERVFTERSNDKKTVQGVAGNESLRASRAGDNLPDEKSFGSGRNSKEIGW